MSDDEQPTIEKEESEQEEQPKKGKGKKEKSPPPEPHDVDKLGDVELIKFNLSDEHYTEWETAANNLHKALFDEEDADQTKIVEDLFSWSGFADEAAENAAKERLEKLNAKDLKECGTFLAQDAKLGKSDMVTAVVEYLKAPRETGKKGRKRPTREKKEGKGKKKEEEEEEEEKPKRAKRAKKDPNAPKRARGAYIFFTQDKRAEVVKANPQLQAKEVMSELGKLWKTLTDEEKKVYEEEAEKDKERAKREREEYEESGKKAEWDAKESGKKKETKTKAKPKEKKGKKKEEEEEEIKAPSRAQLKGKIVELVSEVDGGEVSMREIRTELEKHFGMPLNNTEQRQMIRDLLNEALGQ